MANNLRVSLGCDWRHMDRHAGEVTVFTLRPWWIPGMVGLSVGLLGFTADLTWYGR